MKKKGTLTFTYMLPEKEGSGFGEGPKSGKIAEDRWFADVLKTIPKLEVDVEPRIGISDTLSRKEWGGLIFVRHKGMKFWIALCRLQDEAACAPGHIRYEALVDYSVGFWSLVLSFTKRGQRTLDSLADELQGAITRDPRCRDVAWVPL